MRHACGDTWPGHVYGDARAVAKNCSAEKRTISNDLRAVSPIFAGKQPLVFQRNTRMEEGFSNTGVSRGFLYRETRFSCYKGNLDFPRVQTRRNASRSCQLWICRTSIRSSYFFSVRHPRSREFKCSQPLIAMPEFQSHLQPERSNFYGMVCLLHN